MYTPIIFNKFIKQILYLWDLGKMMGQMESKLNNNQ